MTPAERLSADDSAASPARQPLASWYTQGESDGLGDRLLMFDNSGTPSLELLRFRQEISAAFGFEGALRERVEALRTFSHPSFPAVRAVEHLEGSNDLTLVSTFIPGKRLSEVFRSPRAGLHPSFASWLIRELTPALADLQSHAPGITHGALTPDRIVLTSDGRLIIIEHVLGAAIEQLHFSPRQLWQELGIVGRPAPYGVSKLDSRADVVQLALVALSVLLGRRITADEYPTRVDALLEEFASSTAMRPQAQVGPLRDWLEQALKEDGTGFGSAAEARAGLRNLADPRKPAKPETLPPPQSRPAPALPVAQPAPRAETTSNSEHDMSANGAPSPNPTPDDSQSLDFFSPETPDAEGAASTPPSHAAPSPVKLSPALASPFLRTPPPAPAPAPVVEVAATSKGFAVSPALVLGVVALIEGVAIGALLLTRPKPAEAPAPPIVNLASPTGGDTVVVNGLPVGVTPYQLAVGSNIRSIEIQTPLPIGADAPAGQPVSQVEARAKAQAPAASDRPASSPAPAAADALATAAARQKSGGFRITAPIEVQVLEGDRVLGSSADGPIVTTAGTHQLDFVNAAYGYRSRQTVEIKAGQIGAMTVTPPPGRVSVNVSPWANVWIDGTSYGETPLANLPMTVGEHQITFRHPQLGERTERFIVRAGALVRVSATLGQ